MYFGTMPNGVSSPCGEVTSTTDPTVAPISSAMSLLRLIGGIAAPRSCTLLKSSGDVACVAPLSATAGETPAVTAGEDAGATLAISAASAWFKYLITVHPA